MSERNKAPPLSTSEPYALGARISAGAGGQLSPEPHLVRKVWSESVTGS